MVPSYTSFLKKCAINTPIDMGTESSEWIKAWFSCLNHSYHMATRKLIEDCFINGRSSRSNIGKEVFFKEIHNAARMFRRKIVCHVPKIILPTFSYGSYSENHYFSSHALMKCLMFDHTIDHINKKIPPHVVTFSYHFCKDAVKIAFSSPKIKPTCNCHEYSRESLLELSLIHI